MPEVVSLRDELSVLYSLQKMSFKPLYYGEQERGKTIPNTKRRYIWTFQIGNTKHQLQLFCSFISSKRVVVLDGLTLHQSKNFTFDFQWEHQLEQHILRIKQEISWFPLKVDGLDFIERLQYEAWGHTVSLLPSEEHNGMGILEKNEGGPFIEFQNQDKSISSIEMVDLGKFPLSSVNNQNHRRRDEVIDHSQIQVQFPVFNAYPPQLTDSSQTKNDDLDLLPEQEQFQSVALVVQRDASSKVEPRKQEYWLP